MLPLHAADSEQSTADFEEAAHITTILFFDSVILIPQEEQSGTEENYQVNPDEKNEANQSNEEDVSEPI